MRRAARGWFRACGIEEGTRTARAVADRELAPSTGLTGDCRVFCLGYLLIAVIVSMNIAVENTCHVSVRCEESRFVQYRWLSAKPGS